MKIKGAALNTSLSLTLYERRFQQPVLDLLFRSTYVHTHLDWQETAQWLANDDSIMRLCWQEDQLQGLIAASSPLNGTCWIRLAAVQHRAAIQTVLEELWTDLARELRSRQVEAAYLLLVNDWLARYLPNLGFYLAEEVITLRRAGWQHMPAKLETEVAIRAAEPEDLETILAVDQAAFAPPWQLSREELWQAYRIADSCTIGIVQGTAAGYQLSTLYHTSGHLARLAVLPAFQGKQVGSALVEDLIYRFWRRQVQTITVNTQVSNHRSQHLYTRYGFQRNGYDLRVWKADL